MQTDFIILKACPSANYNQIGKYLEKEKYDPEYISDSYFNKLN